MRKQRIGQTTIEPDLHILGFRCDGTVKTANVVIVVTTGGTDSSAQSKPKRQQCRKDTD